ncbi:methyltransferase, putative [Bodo saltans]|uniref:Methyltransferase, putative n=1 Tax=Bodo saltans TaxID=75058 RepID=A0A0S4J3E2_BODSA|nr:methyltransferase, putative [Bodo saltans]|eukprot:CUG69994.1 methyltransferase, putative [Bodo saltans]
MHRGGSHHSQKGRIRLIVAVLAAAGVLMYFAAGGSFKVEVDDHIRTTPIDPNKDLSGVHSVQDLTPAPVLAAADDDLLKFFVNDPSIEVRCKETAAPNLPVCDAFHFDRKELSTLPPLMVPFTTGQTTKGMVLKPATEVLNNPSIKHHPIFSIYGNHTAVAAVTDEHRVLEFNGVHTEYDFDCEANVDFRLYHQCRAALCLEHETRLAAKANNVGQFPLVDEEYMEYIMTLTTAYEAARSGASYTFIELGARYGTWIVRAGVSFKLFDPVGKLNLLAVEGNCKWFRKMEEHVRCNHLVEESKLILSYAAPKSYNKVEVANPSTFDKPRAVSMLEMLPGYDFVDMIDFDIQGFEWLTIEEPGALELMTQKIGFAHFGTHSTEIEKRVVSAMQNHGCTQHMKMRPRVCF